MGKKNGDEEEGHVKGVEEEQLNDFVDNFAENNAKYHKGHCKKHPEECEKNLMEVQCYLTLGSNKKAEKRCNCKSLKEYGVPDKDNPHC